MLNNICYILTCLAVGGVWGYKIREGIQKKDCFEIIYSFVLCAVIAAMMIFKIVDMIVG